MAEDFERLVTVVRGWIEAAERVVVLTGAGVSTDSGIPDFRGPKGVWTRNPEAEKQSTIQHYVADPEVRRRAWRSRLESPAWSAQPNAGHRALVALERRGKLDTLITQNIDGLHQAAGSSPERVVEVHGTMREVVCLACGQRAPMERALARVRAGEDDPPCRTCGGRVCPSAGRPVRIGLERPPNMAQASVLVVDGYRGTREAHCEILRSAGYRCLLAANWWEAMGVFRRERPELVVTGVRIPIVTGVELLRDIRREDPDAAVIVLTGDPAMDVLRKCYELGAFKVLMKPVIVDELLIFADRALERRQLLIERRQHQQADGQLQAADRTTLGRADLAQRDVLILVVEEDRGVRELFQHIFDSAGYRCLLAGDGEEGFKVFRESRPSLVIADLGMPMVRGGKSVRDAGIRLLLEIRQEDPNAAVIVASGNPDVKTAIESLKLGAYAFLMKAITVDELLITAERALERRQLLVERRQRAASPPA